MRKRFPAIGCLDRKAPAGEQALEEERIR